MSADISDEQIARLADLLWERGEINSLSKTTAVIFARAILALAAQPEATAAPSYGVKQYLDAVLFTGSSNERIVAQTALHMLASHPPATAALEQEVARYCQLCGGTGGHWEGCKAPDESTVPPVGTEAPAGWKLVPVDPTGAMALAATKVALTFQPHLRPLNGTDVWTAMLNAAPSSPRAASPEPARVSLKEEQLTKAFARARVRTENYGDWFDVGARFAEDHHGIGIAAEKESGK